MPAIDPDRASWESDVLFAFAECAGKHRATIDAWLLAQQKVTP